MLIVSPEFSCSQEVLTIVAMLSGAFYFIALLMGLTIPPGGACSTQHLATAEQHAERS